MKKIFITDYVGLSTRLEALAIAFLISERLITKSASIGRSSMPCKSLALGGAAEA